MSPFLRQGIVSSVYPFPGVRPHGFTIDIMQQGGSSGSPIFPVGDSTVIGMMVGSVIDNAKVQTDKGNFTVPQNTNISFAEPGHIIRLALEEFLNHSPIREEGTLTLKELRDRYPQGTSTDSLDWDPLGAGNIFGHPE